MILYLIVHLSFLFHFHNLSHSSHNQEFFNSSEKFEPPMVKKYTAYNLWANQRLTTWLEEANDSLFIVEIESSFPSLKKTIEHIWNAEAGWLNAIEDKPWGDAPSKGFVGTKVEVLEEWLKVSKLFDDYVQNMPLEKLSLYKLNSSGKSELRYIDMIHHCMNHSTYHRGQLITMGRQLGLKNPPQTDFVYYLRQLNK